MNSAKKSVLDDRPVTIEQLVAMYNSGAIKRVYVVAEDQNGLIGEFNFEADPASPMTRSLLC